MRRANNTGTIFKLKGNRHCPYAAYIYGEKVINEEKGTTYRKRKAIGYYPTRKEAQEALEFFLSQPYDIVNHGLSLEAVWQLVYDKLDVSQSRMDAYKYAFKYLAPIKAIPLKDLRTTHLQEVIDDCPQGYSVKSNVKIIINKCYKYGLENDIVQKDYSQFVKLQKEDAKVERHIFTGEEVAKVWQRAGEWQYDFLAILLYTGARPNEIIDLLKENVNLKDGYFKIIASKTDAGVRTVPIHKRLLPLFSRLMQTDGKYLIQTDKGLKIQYKNYATRDIVEIREYLGADITLYDCRHTFVTIARERGIDLLALQRIVGHKSQTVTEQVYTHIQLQELISKINLVEYV